MECVGLLGCFWDVDDILFELFVCYSGGMGYIFVVVVGELKGNV